MLLLLLLLLGISRLYVVWYFLYLYLSEKFMLLAVCFVCVCVERLGNFRPERIALEPDQSYIEQTHTSPPPIPLNTYTHPWCFEINYL